MKTLFKSLFFSLLFTLFFTACSKDDASTPEPTYQGAYDNGYFILNEGSSGFTSPFTFVAADGTIIQDAFESVNPETDPIGTYLQDMFFDATRAFIISGSANTITVFNRYTLQYITTVSSNLMAPRYGTVIGNKAYVTNSADWSDNTDDYITIIDLNTYETSTQALNKNAEKILSNSETLYISNGYYGNGETITIMNTTTQNTETINFGSGNSPVALQKADGMLYVLTNNANATSQVFTIDPATHQILNTVAIPASLGDAKNLQVENNLIYFTSGASVYSFESSQTTVSETPVMTYTSNSGFGVMYGFRVKDSKIYIADAGNFSSASTAYEYSLSGSLLKTITTGVAPNSFHFN